MRVWLFAFLLAVPFSYALVVESSGQAGTNPVMYGELIAYERDGFVHVYDAVRNEDAELSRGSAPFIYGFTVVFETREADVDLNGDGDKDDVVIQYVNARDKKVVSTKAVGRHPNVFADTIGFSTKESELGIDFTNDGDEGDDIIRYYDITSGEIANTKASGDYPAVNQKYIVFQSEEEQANFDLNADGDKVDTILRIYNREDHQFSNVPVAGTRPVLSKDSRAVFVSNGQIKVLDARAGKVTETGQSGSSPSIYNGVVMFSHEGKLYGFDAEKQTVAKLDVVGDAVSVFEDHAAVASSEKTLGDLNGDGDQDDVVIRYVRSEDGDGDNVSDFLDNCPAVINVGQADSDKNGVGDACEKPKKSELKKREEAKAESQANETGVPEPASGIPWYWFVLVIVLLPFVAYYGYKYYKKKQKSFGF